MDFNPEMYVCTHKILTSLFVLSRKWANLFRLLRRNVKNFRIMLANFLLIFTLYRGPGSSVGIATDYGLDGPGSNPGVDEIFRPSRPALGPTQPPAKWVPGLSRG